jgi:hypothetical protein
MAASTVVMALASLATFFVSWWLWRTTSENKAIAKNILEAYYRPFFDVTQTKMTIIQDESVVHPHQHVR